MSVGEALGAGLSTTGTLGARLFFRGAAGPGSSVSGDAAEPSPEGAAVASAEGAAAR
jgi:hypothetical protein